MIDDFGGGQLHGPRKKPKIIEPLPKEERPPLPSFGELADEQPEEHEAPFKTPEQAATADEDAPDLAVTPADKPVVAHHRKRRWPFTRRQTAIAGATIVLLLTCGLTSYALTRPNVKGGTYQSIRGNYVPPKPTTVASKLTGLQVDPSVNQRPVTGVMIENSLDARPQSGLDQAGVVFEAIAEGGITRFLALYQDTQPDYLGPVRSVRPYFLQWCMGLDCSLAHVGGSPEGLQDVKNWGSKDLDQFYNAGAYHRISSRYAPHNMYTSMSQLNQLESAKGFGASNYEGFTRKKDAPSKAPNATSIDLDISGYYYNDHYDYDAATNSYKRSEGGKAHMSLHKDGSQVQITPKVVVAMVMQYGLEADDHHSQYNVVGSGSAYIFQDGTVTQGTWSKADTKAPLKLTDASGNPIALNAGQTWLTAMSAASEITYK